MEIECDRGATKLKIMQKDIRIDRNWMLNREPLSMYFVFSLWARQREKTFKSYKNESTPHGHTSHTPAPTERRNSFRDKLFFVCTLLLKNKQKQIPLFCEFGHILAVSRAEEKRTRQHETPIDTKQNQKGAKGEGIRNAK